MAAKGLAATRAMAWAMAGIDCAAETVATPQPKRPNMKQLLALALGLAAAALVHAAPVTIEFSASGFQNGGTPYPGFDGPIHGSITWDNDGGPYDPMGALTGIDLTIAGHVYTLAEVGIANEGSTQTAIGASPSGFNAAVGSGAAHDFLLVIDRVNPRIDAFAFTIEGKTGAIWWFPTQTEARFASQDVPEPGGLLLAAAALGALGLARRRQPPSAALSSSLSPTLSPSHA
jgi:MYXO-CTERM domain-containing protein